MLAGSTTGNARVNTPFVEYCSPSAAAGFGLGAAFRFERPGRGIPLAGPEARGLDLGLLAAALEALPLPAALTTATGEALCANQGLLAVLGVTRGSMLPAIRLPLPEGRMGRGGGRQEVRAGRLPVARLDGAVLSPLVVAVELGCEGCRLYLLVDVDAPGAVLDAGLSGDLLEMDPGSKLDTLTFRERHVLRLLIAGRSNKAVARELGISPRTVEVHRSRVLHKLGARSLTQAFAVAMAAGLAMEKVAPAAGAGAAPGGAAYSLQFR